MVEKITKGQTPAIQSSLEKWLVVEIQIELRKDFLNALRSKIKNGDRAKALEALATVEQSIIYNDQLLRRIFDGPTDHLTLSALHAIFSGRSPNSR